MDLDYARDPDRAWRCDRSRRAGADLMEQPEPDSYWLAERSVIEVSRFASASLMRTTVPCRWSSGNDTSTGSKLFQSFVRTAP